MRWRWRKPCVQRVETREDFLSALEAGPPDVILSDHSLPSFDGFAALALAREKCPQVPFLFVTNALTRQMEIEKLSPGVADYVPKSHLQHLTPAIWRALRQTNTLWSRRAGLNEREQVAEKILALLDEYEHLGGCLPICSQCKKIRDQHSHWQPPELFFLKYTGLKFTHGICPDCFRQWLQP